MVTIHPPSISCWEDHCCCPFKLERKNKNFLAVDPAGDYEDGDDNDDDDVDYEYDEHSFGLPESEKNSCL